MSEPATQRNKVNQFKIQRNPLYREIASRGEVFRPIIDYGVQSELRGRYNNYLLMIYL